MTAFSRILKFSNSYFPTDFHISFSTNKSANHVLYFRTNLSFLCIFVRSAFVVYVLLNEKKISSRQQTKPELKNIPVKVYQTT